MYVPGRTKAEDIKLGLQSEDEVKHHLEMITGCPLTKTHNTFDTMDFEGDGCWIELKTRLWTPAGAIVNHNTYSTTIFSLVKGMDAHKRVKAGKRVYFAFRFADGIYYWVFSKQAKNYEIKDQYRYRDGKEEYTGPHIHIPIGDLHYLEGS